MKKMILILTLSLLYLNSYSQKPATPEHIKTFLEVTGSAKIGVQVVENMVATFKKSTPNVPAEFWDEFIKDVKPETLIELITPIYAKHFSDSDIVQLIEFYKTPLGMRIVEKLPLITQESYAVGAEWGKKLGEQAVKKLTEKGYVPANQ